MTNTLVHVTTEISLAKLAPSPLNVRRVAATGIDGLAASIATHGLLQPLVVVHAEKDRYQVIAGGRRLAALKRLAKDKRLPKSAMIPCRVVKSDAAGQAEASL